MGGQRRGLTTCRRFLAIAAVVLAGVGCDRVTKNLAEAHLRGGPCRSYLADTVRLQYTENEGAFMGLGASWPRGVRFCVFTLGTALLVAFLAAQTLATPTPPHIALLGWSLLLSGGLGNLWDRIAEAGQVVDFLNVGMGSMRTAVFNVADLSIVVGASLLLVYGRPRGTRAAPDSG